MDVSESEELRLVCEEVRRTELASQVRTLVDFSEQSQVSLARLTSTKPTEASQHQ